MAVVPLTCPRCAGLIQIDDSLAGQQIDCPLCHGLISVPPAEMLSGSPQPPEVVPPPVELLPLICPACGSSFQVARTLAGHRVACPACNQLVTAAAIASAEPPAPPVQSRPAEARPLRVLTPKERARRRFTRDLVLWIVCLAILVAALWLLR